MEHIDHPDLATAESAAAEYVAARLARASDERGTASLAISGGRSPWGMLARLAEQPVPWSDVHIFQVDERIVPLEDESRNWKRFLASTLARRIPAAHRHAMPVEIDDPERAAREYEHTLTQQLGDPPILDVAHLGLGDDGHTASLIAGDPLLDADRRWVGTSQRYQGHIRLTLTLPALNLARSIVWFVIGAARRPVLKRLLAADSAIPAGRVRQDHAICFSSLAPR